jgi:Replication initiator protein A
MAEEHSGTGIGNPFLRTKAAEKQLPLQLEGNATTQRRSLPSQSIEAPPDFIKIEKNLASLGFFTPSHKRIRGIKQKVITLSREVNGKRIEAQATILPSAQYGLPTTADQDTYLAILKLATDMHRRHGRVDNPIGFTSAEILRIQGKSCVSGYHYKELHEQLMRVKTATILSEGAVYFAGRRAWAKDAFNVITRLVLLGTRLDDGTVADKHYVWFSDWQLENINNNYLLPIDYDSYKQLRNHISKILVPLLQIWLYASRDAGCFEKRYEEVCQFLNIRAYEHLSKIREKLGPSLDELKKHGYLSDWRVERTKDGTGFKVILYHGEKFHRDLGKRVTQRIDSTGARAQELQMAPVPVLRQTVDEQLLKALTDRGISVEVAHNLLLNTTKGQEVMDELEWGDHLIRQSAGGKFRNPPGFYVYLVRANVAPPDHFESSRKKRLQEEAHMAWSRKAQERAALELAYMEYQKQEIDRYIATNFSDESYREAIENSKGEVRASLKNWVWLSEQQKSEVAVSCFRRHIRAKMNFIGFESFCEAKEAGQASS